MNRVAALCLIFALILVVSDDGGVGSFDLPSDRLRVLVIEETASRSTLTRPQQEALFGQDIRRMVRDAGGEFRLWDQDMKFGPKSPEAQWFRDALKLPRTSLPWLVVANKSNGESVPLPKTKEEILAEIEKFK